MSSPPSVSSSIVKGGVNAAFKMWFGNKISISPVAIFYFFASRSITVPLLILNSLPSVLLVQMLACLTFFIKSDTVAIDRANQFMNPLSRDFCTQPASVTSVFM
jgi:hypothetical protein